MLLVLSTVELIMNRKSDNTSHARRIGVICYFDPDTYPGVVNSCNCLVKSGWEVDLVCIDQYGFGGQVFDDRVRIQRLPISSSGALSNLRRYMRLLRTARCVGKNRNWQFMIGHDMHGFIAARACRVVSPERVVFWSQDMAEPSRLTFTKRVLYMVKRRLLKSCVLAIAASQSRSEAMQKYLPLNSKPLVVYNSPPMEVPNVPSQNLRLHLGIAEEAVIGVYTGGIGRNRYVPEMVESVKYWPENCHLVVVGYGNKDVIAEIKRIASSATMKSRVHILPHQPSVWSLLTEADFGISLFELDKGHRNLLHRGLASNKIFEYIAFGNPAIVTENSETRAFMEKFGCGVCVALPNPGDIALKVREIVENRERLAVMSANAAMTHRAETHFEKRWRGIQQILDSGDLTRRPKAEPAESGVMTTGGIQCGTVNL